MRKALLTLTALAVIGGTAQANEFVVPYMIGNLWGWYSFVKITNVSENSCTITATLYDDHGKVTDTVEMGTINPHQTIYFWGEDVRKKVKEKTGVDSQTFAVRFSADNCRLVASAVMKNESYGHRSIPVLYTDQLPDRFKDLYVKGFKEVIPYTYGAIHNFYRFANTSDSQVKYKVVLRDDAGNSCEFPESTLSAHSVGAVLHENTDNKAKEMGCTLTSVTGSTEVYIYAEDPNEVATVNIMQIGNQNRTIFTDRFPILDENYYQTQLNNLPLALSAAMWLWEDGVNTALVKKDYPAYSTFACDSGTFTVENSGSDYTVTYNNCNWDSIKALNGKVKYTVTNSYKDVVFETLTNLTFKSADEDVTYTIQAGSTGSLSAPDFTDLANYATHYVGTVNLNSLSATVIVDNSGNTKTYVLKDFTGSGKHIYKYSYEDMTLSGTVDVDGRSWSISTDNLTAKDFEIDDYTTHYDHHVVTGSLNLTEKTANLKVEYRADNPDAVGTKEIRILQDGVVVGEFDSVR
jgi:hypothetical protein